MLLISITFLAGAVSFETSDSSAAPFVLDGLATVRIPLVRKLRSTPPSICPLFPVQVQSIPLRCNAGGPACRDRVLPVLMALPVTVALVALVEPAATGGFP